MCDTKLDLPARSRFDSRYAVGIATTPGQAFNILLPTDLRFRFVYGFCERYATATGNTLTGAAVQHETQLAVVFRDTNGQITAEYPLGDSYNPVTIVESAFVAFDGGQVHPDAILADIPTPAGATVFARPICAPLRGTIDGASVTIEVRRCMTLAGYATANAIRAYVAVRSQSHPF